MIIMRDKEMVSVVIPSFNRADSIRKAAESVLNQTYNNLELIKKTSRFFWKVSCDGETNG